MAIIQRILPRRDRRTFGSCSALIVAFGLAGCGEGDEMRPPLDEENLPLFGDVNQTVSATGPFVRAVARVRKRDANLNVLGNCSGTMIAANKYLTARHCFCPPAVATNSFIVNAADDAKEGQRVKAVQTNTPASR